MPVINALDIAATTACEALSASLDVAWNRTDALRSVVPLGIEIEVKWRSYFPELYRRFGLDRRAFSQLDTHEIASLTAACSALEENLLPRLHATVAAGVPRGNDRYWEFAFNPVRDAALLLDQVALLSAAGLVPREGDYHDHSLQVTVGDIAPCADLYYLAMLLEARFVQPERLTRGLAQASLGPIYTGWARKGRSGIHRKEAGELVGGSLVASEIRMLTLPQRQDHFEALMSTLVDGVNAIVDAQAGRETAASRGWRATVRVAREALAAHGLPDRNWAGTHRDERPQIDAPSWARFIESLSHLRERLDAEIPSGTALVPA